MEPMTCPWCSVCVVPRADDSCPACNHSTVNVDALDVGDYRAACRLEQERTELQDARWAVCRAVALMVLGALLVWVQARIRIPLAGGWGLSVITWSGFLFGFFQFVEAVPAWMSAHPAPLRD